MLLCRSWAGGSCWSPGKARLKGAVGQRTVGDSARTPTTHLPLSATDPCGAALSGVTTASKQDKNSRQGCLQFELPAGEMGLDAGPAVTCTVQCCWLCTGSVLE